MDVVGILHPGQMGVSVAAAVKAGGYRVLWASESRSKESKERAEGNNLEDVGTLDALIHKSSIIISVCPPHGAEDLAYKVMETGYRGTYLDANAISNIRAVRIGKKMIAGGISFVDGGIIGGPAWEPGKTWLYLSGPDASRVEPIFQSGPLETEVIGTEIGKASALKMCYASYTKGTTALLCGILAAAEQLGVRNNLEEEWDRSGPLAVDLTQNRIRRVTAKAWRFQGEMEEIADTFEVVGTPGGFHRAAAEIYGRISQFKGLETTPPLEEVLSALSQPEHHN